MKHKMSRQDYIDGIEDVYGITDDFMFIEQILEENGASYDDIDSNEGIYSNMKDAGLIVSFRTIMRHFIDADDPVVRYKALYHLNDYEGLDDYHLGWLDGYESSSHSR